MKADSGINREREDGVSPSSAGCGRPGWRFRRIAIVSLAFLSVLTTLANPVSADAEPDVDNLDAQAGADQEPTVEEVEVDSEPTSAASLSGKTTQQIEGDWIHYRHGESLPGAKLVTIQGERSDRRTSSGCRFTFTNQSKGRLKANQVEVGRERSFNERACTMKMEVGILSISDARRRGLAPSKAELNRGAESKDLAPDLRNRSALRSNGRFLWMAYIDPVGIRLTSTTSRLKWWYDNSGCIRGSQHSASWRWFRASGWYRVSGTWGYRRGRCTGAARTDLRGTYQSDSFPTCGRIRHTHEVNSMTGYSNGNFRFYGRATKYGRRHCTNLNFFNYAWGPWGGL